MITRNARIYIPALAVNLLLVLHPAIGYGSTPPNLSPDGQTNTKTTPFTQSKPKPSVLDKMTIGAKKFFSGLGNALTLKKTETKTTATPTNPWIKPQKEEKTSWLSSMFHKDETKKAKKPSEWIQQPRVEQ